MKHIFQERIIQCWILSDTEAAFSWLGKQEKHNGKGMNLRPVMGMKEVYGIPSRLKNLNAFEV